MTAPWSQKEKKVARRVFDLAVANAEKDVLKRHAEKRITSAEELWKYELEIRQWRKELSATLQYTYSRLEWSFSACIIRGWLKEQDLEGLRPDRIASILKNAASLK